MPAYDPSTHNDRINIDITLGSISGGTATLTTILVLQDGVTPGGGRFQEYASTVEVADDVLLGNLDATSQAIADIMFGQPNPPEKILFGQVGSLEVWTLTIDTATAAEVYGVDMTVPGAVDINVTAAGSPTPTTIAAQIAAAWNANATTAAAATAVPVAGVVTFTSTTQNGLVITEDENAAKMTLVHAADTLETPTVALTALIAAGAEFYGVLYTNRTVAQQILVATAIEGLESSGSRFLFGFQSSDTDWLGGTFPAAYAAIEGYERTVGYFHDDNENDATSDRLDAAHFADRLSWSPDETSATWNSAVSDVDELTTKLTQTQKGNARENHMNTALPMGTTTRTYVDPGETMNGRPADHVVSADWLFVRMGERLQNLWVSVAAKGTKIPLDEQGQALVGGQIGALLLEGVDHGHFEADPIPTVTPQPITAADIAARKFRFKADGTLVTGALGADIDVFLGP